MYPRRLAELYGYWRRRFNNKCVLVRSLQDSITSLWYHLSLDEMTTTLETITSRGISRIKRCIPEPTLITIPLKFSCIYLQGSSWYFDLQGHCYRVSERVLTTEHFKHVKETSFKYTIYKLYTRNQCQGQIFSRQDVMIWKIFLRYWPFVMGNPRP